MSKLSGISRKSLVTGGLTFAAAGLAAMLLAPRPAAADVAVAVQVPAVQVSVGGPQGPAPGPGYVWEPESWVRQNGEWVKRGGYWRPANPQVVVAQPVQVYDPGVQEAVEVDVAPPAPIVEVRPAMPVAGAVWIPGYWQWSRGRHVWVTGRWSAPRPGYVWVGQSWARHGRRWAYAPGHWQPVARPAYYGRGGWDRDRDRDRDRDHDRGHHGRRDHDRHR